MYEYKFSCDANWWRLVNIQKLSLMPITKEAANEWAPWQNWLRATVVKKVYFTRDTSLNIWSYEHSVTLGTSHSDLKPVFPSNSADFWGLRWRWNQLENRLYKTSKIKKIYLIICSSVLFKVRNFLGINFFLFLPPQICSAVSQANTRPPGMIYDGPLKAGWVTQLPQQLLVHSK